MKIVSLRLKEEEHKRLKETAEEFGMSVSALIRYAVTEKNGGLNAGASVDDLRENIKAELDLLQANFAQLKSELAQQQHQAIEQLSKQLNRGFAIEMDQHNERLEELVKNLLAQVLAMKGMADHYRPIPTPTR